LWEVEPSRGHVGAEEDGGGLVEEGHEGQGAAGLLVLPVKGQQRHPRLERAEALVHKPNLLERAADEMRIGGWDPTCQNIERVL
jgi:hypothetical protein